ncbi:hypothetical protein T440DRAFT_467900 [Plenodomus tracheiphilus IPT5]|uniref:Microbial-type PARG catalytic domain-containing protein n=1 Tax=Plenodomus tracheiphilus IPT5 TaxID=1408161 RepID=A0A6A7B8X5_9PLEO|nr:hypothetical protein T440DRAFT_467900 [Plenodomus tracheiphilus IPT5]
MHQSSILGFLRKGNPSRSEQSRSDSSRPERAENSGPGQPYRPRTNADSRQEPFEHRRGHGGYGRAARGRGRGDQHHRGYNTRRNDVLKLVADETKAELPKILSTIPSFDAAESSSHDLEDLTALDPLECPGHVLSSNDGSAGQKGTRIRVLNMDTFDAALQLDPNYKAHTHLRLASPVDTTASISNSALTPTIHYPTANDTDTIMQDAPIFPLIGTSPTPSNTTLTTSPPTPVLVLNLASERSPGGGWSKGALAQEECLCYRSSLSLSLNTSFYPIPSLSCIYTPSVLLLRSSMSTGHSLLTPSTSPLNLPVVSVLSIAALRQPRLTSDATGEVKFKHEGQRAETKRKIRLTLRVATLHGHKKLVLGALGCGVFANPAKEVAECFLEVFREKEFQGGWWDEVVFAVLDNVKGSDGGKDGKGNYGVFWRVLDGEVV